MPYCMGVVDMLPMLCCNACADLQPSPFMDDGGGGAALPADIEVTATPCISAAAGSTTAVIFNVKSVVNPEWFVDVSLQLDFPTALWPTVAVHCQDAAAQGEHAAALVCLDFNQATCGCYPIQSCVVLCNVDNTPALQNPMLSPLILFNNGTNSINGVLVGNFPVADNVLSSTLSTPLPALNHQLLIRMPGVLTTIL